jgi:cytochrome b subunit of formate dehydrogenase
MPQGSGPLIRWPTASALLATVVLIGSVAGADEIGTEACLACHGNEGFASPSGHPLYTNPEAFSGSVHGSLPCTTCHGDITELPHAEKLKPVGTEPCTLCHSDAVTAYQGSIHGQARAKGVGEAASCGDCHGNVHAITPHTEPTSAAHWSHMAASCARCHAKIELAEKFHIPVVRPVDAYLQSTHARAVAAGKHGAVCSDCHGAHDILPTSDPRSKTARGSVPATCGACHAKILAAYRESVHGVALAQGHRDAPVCTECHGEHRILGAGDPNSPVFASNISTETCGRCHANARLSEKYGIGQGKVAAFDDSFHGLALRSGQLTVANCASCHGVHDILPEGDPRSHVNPANLAATCGKCHPGAGTRFRIGTVHGTSTSTGAWAVGWVRFTYMWLIGITIGGMVLHNSLDLSRKARHGLHSAPALPLNQPERMTRALRRQHGLVMLSFPVLVYTGFALKYPEGWWAAPLLQWEARLGLRGAIHRAAAIVMVVGVVWHLLELATSPRLRACMRHMLPSARDARVAFGTVAYYVGLATHAPHGGTLNYAEKAEYWAFMWGTAVMTLTGFLLWFENTTLSYLPSWVPDVATALHFYEAILATLAILVWHFYWVIFDPDVYPMDWTWWDGHPPATREMERQSTEKQKD